MDIATIAIITIAVATTVVMFYGLNKLSEG